MPILALSHGGLSRASSSYTMDIIISSPAFDFIGFSGISLVRNLTGCRQTFLDTNTLLFCIHLTSCILAFLDSLNPLIFAICCFACSDPLLHQTETEKSALWKAETMSSDELTCRVTLERQRRPPDWQKWSRLMRGIRRTFQKLAGMMEGSVSQMGGCAICSVSWSLQSVVITVINTRAPLLPSTSRFPINTLPIQPMQRWPSSAQSHSSIYNPVLGH